MILLAARMRTIDGIAYFVAALGPDPSGRRHQSLEILTWSHGLSPDFVNQNHHDLWDGPTATMERAYQRLDEWRAKVRRRYPDALED